MINAIVACDINNGIGKSGALPWPHNAEDMKWFRDNTEGGIVVMGRKTWESIGCRKLPRRKNLVITNSKIYGDYDMKYYGNMQKVLQNIQSDNPYANVWIIGGGEIYSQALPFCDRLYLTKFKDKYECDTFLDPEQLKPFIRLINSKNSDVCSFSVWSRT
jgi:dihydrofolate reductase